MADILKTDLCIIGAGTLGTTLATDARDRDIDVILVPVPGDEQVEARAGALQQAALKASAARAHAMATASALGLAKVDPKPNFRAISERAARLADADATATTPARLGALGITVLEGPAVFADPRTLRVGGTGIRADQFVLATGSRPQVPALPGLDQVSYFTPDSILANMRKLSHLLVLGGDATALELAQAYARLGSVVTLVPQGPLLAGFDPEPVAVLLRALREEGINILEGARVTAVLPRNQGTGIAVAHVDGSLATLDVSHILLAAGREADVDSALLAAAGLKHDPSRPGQWQLSPEGRSANARIVVLDSANGGEESPLALRQAALVLERAGGAGKGRIDPLRIPRSIDTSPALAQIGQLGVDAPLRPGQTVLRANASETAAARAAGAGLGSAKLVVDSSGAIAGGAFLGAGAAELAAMLALALDRGVTAPDLADLLLPSASLAALLTDLGRQYRAQHRPSAWAQRRAALRRLLP